MFALSCNISIGSITMKACHGVEIKRSVREISSTATIKLPVTSVLSQSGKEKTKIETAKQFNKGDKVKIELGYNGELETEFNGFVRNINYKTPLEIECEGWAYKLRESNYKKSWPKGTLKDVINEITSRTTIGPGVIVDLNLKNFVLNDNSAYSALEKLKRDYGLAISVDNDGKLHACKVGDVVGDKVIYRFRENILKDDDLKYYQASDLIVKVKGICYMRDGSTIEATVGKDGGEVKTLYFYDVPDVPSLKELVKQELNKHTFDGYRGKITTFLRPFAEPGMIADLTDNIYPSRGGNYYIESTTVTFGRSGARRVVDLGLKM